MGVQGAGVLRRRRLAAGAAAWLGLMVVAGHGQAFAQGWGKEMPTAMVEAAVPVPIAFTVWREGSPIGHHRIAFRREGDRLIAEVDIRLEVKMAFVTVYRYQHTNREVWQDGRLVALDSWTNDDGTTFSVRARATEGGLRVDGAEGSFVAPADTLPTSWWNPAILRGGPLLDTRLGRMAAVAVEPVGTGPVAAGGGEVAGRQYRMTGDVAADLWYDEAGRWVKMALMRRGSLVEYRLDPPAGRPGSLAAGDAVRRVN